MKQQEGWWGEQLWHRAGASALLVLLTLAAPASAAPLPAGRVYFAILMGLEGPYEIRAECFEFTKDRICVLGGETCGEWQRSEATGKQTGFELGFSLVDTNEPLEIAGQARLDAGGKQSSVGGTARIQMEGAQLNFAFAARQVRRQDCRDLADTFGTEQSGPEPDVDAVGSGRLETESRSVRKFNAVSLRDTGLLVVDQTGQESLTITAEDNILPLLKSEVRNGLLELGIASSGDVRPTLGITYRLTVQDLDEITLDGNAEIQAAALDSPLLVVDLSGNSTATLGGESDQQELRISGSASYQAEELESREVTVDQSGSSHAVLRVSDRIDGTVGGSALLEYIGNPAVNLEVTGSATVRRIGG